MVSTSFMKVKGVLPDEPILLPRLPLYTQNYVKAWVSNHFQTYFVNTIVVSFGGVVVNLLVSLTMAYSFARFKFPGKEWMFNLLLLTMMIPAQLAMISQYTVLNGLKLIDDYKGIWLLWGGTCVAGNTFFTGASLNRFRESWKSPCIWTALPGCRPFFTASFL